MNRLTDRKDPLYLTIKQHVVGSIESGVWPIDHKLPSEEELQERFGVSRGTVRRALYDLELEGLITRMAGRGTFVKRKTPLFEKPGAEILSFTQQIKRCGMTPSTKVLFAGTARARDLEGRLEGFGISYDTDVIHIKRLREADGVPLTIQSVYLLPMKAPGILEEDLSCLFDLYRRKYGRQIVAMDEIFHAAPAAPEEAELLGIEPEAPVLIRDRVSYDQHGDLFEILHAVDRGDKIRYRNRSGNGAEVEFISATERGC